MQYFHLTFLLTRKFMLQYAGSPLKIRLKIKYLGIELLYCHTDNTISNKSNIKYGSVQ